MATLQGHAVRGAAPLVGAAYEHTYVTSDDGYVWDCLGRSRGGRVLSSGAGNSAVARCVSYPRAPGAPLPVYAGLRYGRDGVCHQMANRILRTAGIDVSGARRYRQSLHLYGRFGKVPWPQWQQCLSSSSAAWRGISGSGGGGGSGDMAQTRMKERLDALYERFQAESGEADPDYGDPRLQRAELEIMIDEMLGIDYDPRRRRRLLQIEASLRARQSRLDTALDRGRVAPAQYLDRLRATIADAAHAYEAVLGREDYVRLFGTEPQEASAIIDPAVLATRGDSE